MSVLLKDEVVGLVHGVEDLVEIDRDGDRSADAALDLDE